MYLVILGQSLSSSTLINWIANCLWVVWFPSVIHELHFAHSLITPNKDPTVWHDQSRCANTQISSSLGWMALAQLHGITIFQARLPIACSWTGPTARWCTNPAFLATKPSCWRPSSWASRRGEGNSNYRYAMQLHRNHPLLAGELAGVGTTRFIKTKSMVLFRVIHEQAKHTSWMIVKPPNGRPQHSA